MVVFPRMGHLETNRGSVDELVEQVNAQAGMRVLAQGTTPLGNPWVDYERVPAPDPDAAAVAGAPAPAADPAAVTPVAAAPVAEPVTDPVAAPAGAPAPAADPAAVTPVAAAPVAEPVTDPDQDPDPDPDAATDPGKKRRRDPRKRIDQLTAQNYEKDAQIRELRLKLQQQPPAAPAPAPDAAAPVADAVAVDLAGIADLPEKPVETAFENHDEYLGAFFDWRTAKNKRDDAIETRRQNVAEGQSRQQDDLTRRQALQDAHTDRLRTHVAAVPADAELLADTSTWGHLVPTPAMLHAFAATEFGHLAQLDLLRHTEEFNRISRIVDPVKQVEAIAVRGSRLHHDAAPPAPAPAPAPDVSPQPGPTVQPHLVSQTPAPTTPVGGGVAVQSAGAKAMQDAADRGDYQALRAMWKQQPA